MHSRNTLCVHVGQCGTQLGAELWSTALKQHSECAKTGGLSPLVSSQLLEGKHKQVMNAVVVDAEPKVAAKFSEIYHRFQPSVVHGDSGMGGCWASGYNCSTLEASGVLDSSLEAIRRKLESTPCTSLLFTCSLSGGTGSGMTSALLQHCADMYPSINRVVVGVLPFETGDNPLKHYNTMLSAQYIYEFGDAVVLRSNDFLAREASNLSMRHTSTSRTHSIPQMNQVFVQDVATLLNPSRVDNVTTLSNFEQTRSAPSFRSVDDIVSEVCVGRGIAGASFDVYASSKLLHHPTTAKRIAPSRPNDEALGQDKTSTACANLGKTLWSLSQHLQTYHTENHRAWRPARMQLWSSQLPHDMRTATLAFKSLNKLHPLVALPTHHQIQWLQYGSVAWQSIPEIKVVMHAPWIASDLKKHAMRATEMLRVRAFVHWYEREQCSELDIHSAIASVQEQAHLTVSRFRAP